MRISRTLRRGLGTSLALAAALAVSAPVQAQSTFIPSPSGMSGGENLVEFEGFASGDRLTNQLPGLTFTLSTSGGPWIDNTDTTFRPFNPQGVGTIQNWEPGTAPSSNGPDMTLGFGTHINRVGFVIKNPLPDDLILTLRCCANGAVIDTRTFLTVGAFRWVGLETTQPFDQIIVDVTNVVNGAFRIDNLRYECDPSLICDPVNPIVDITSPADGIIVGTTSVTVEADVVDDTSTTVVSTPAGISVGLPPGGGTVSGSIPLVEGANTVSLSATDAAANIGGSSITVISDTIPPSVTILSPSTGSVVGSSPATLSISVGDATATTVSFGANCLGAPAGGGLVSGDVALVKGSNIVVVTAVDAAGNTTSESVEIILDLTAPLIDFDSPADGDCFGPGDSPIAVTATVNDLTATVVNSALMGLSTNVAAGGGVVMGSLALVEGSNTIAITATDEAGRVGSASITVLLDTTGPALTLDTPGVGSSVSGMIDFDATAADVRPGTGLVQVDFFVDGNLVSSQTKAPFGVSYDTITLADGPHTFSVEAIDGKGNRSTASSAVRVDNTPPAIAITNPLPGEILGGAIPFDALVSDNGTGSGVVDVTMLSGGAAPQILDGSQVFPFPMSSVQVSSIDDSTLLVDGPLELQVTAVDGAGNQAAASITVTVDNSAPDKSLVSPVHGAIVDGIVEILATGDDTSLASLQIFVDGVEAGNSPTSPLSVSLDTSTRLDGEMIVSVVATDAAGNSSTCTAHVTVDNMDVKIRPSVFNRKQENLSGRHIFALVWGDNTDLMLPLADHQIELRVPGGNPVPVTDKQPENGVLSLNFDRAQMKSSVEAGIAASRIIPREHTVIQLVVDGFVIGTDRIRIW